MRSSQLLKIVAWLMLMNAFVTVRADAQEQRLFQMLHSSWRGSQGAPEAITALAETPDGRLWIGSFAGLFCFDGIHFRRFGAEKAEVPVPEGSIRSLMTDHDGTLWISRYRGSPYGVRSGRILLTHSVEAEQTTQIWNLHESPKGTLQAVHDNKELVELGHDGHWSPVPGGPVARSYLSDFLVQGDGVTWIVRDGKLFRQRDSLTLETDVSSGFYSKILRGHGGDIWIVNRSLHAGGHQELFSLQHVDAIGQRIGRPYVVPGMNDFLIAADGSVWICAADRAVWKLTLDMQARQNADGHRTAMKLNDEDGLIDVSADTLFQTSDGTVWAGGASGLDSFRPAKISPVFRSMRPGFWSSCISDRNQIWAINSVGDLYTIRNQRESRRNVIKNGDSEANVTCGSDGTAWISSSYDLWTLHAGRLSLCPRVPQALTSSRRTEYEAVVDAPRGPSVVVRRSLTEDEIWSYTSGRWTRELSRQRIGFVSGIHIAKDRRTYLGFMDGTAAVYTETTRREIVGLPSTRVIGFQPTTYGLFAYGLAGLSRISGNRATTVRTDQDSQLQRITGVAEAGNGDLWVNGEAGIQRIAAAQVQQWLVDSRVPVHVERLYEGDFVGPDIFASYRHSIHAGTDGMLWFSTLQGVARVEPTNLPRPLPAPRLEIQSMESATGNMDERSQFSAGTTDVTIRYFAIRLGDPDSVRYRYRLVGVDDRWFNANRITEAHYTGLAPGRYTFVVSAGDTNEGPAMSETTRSFVILPLFWQTVTFRVFAAALSCILIYCLARSRLHAAQERIELLAKERYEERTRIAREMHDSLLQGLQGIVLTVHVAADPMCDGARSRTLMQSALLRGDNLLVEARERIGGLRDELQEPPDNLSTRLMQLVTELSDEHDEITYLTDLPEQPMQLTAVVKAELFAIASEALLNATRHAGAKTIKLRLALNVFRIVLSCSDDGRGFSVEESERTLVKRYGLRGMRERAARIHANFSVQSSSDGTNIRVAVPGWYAYLSQLSKLGIGWIVRK